MNILAIESSCDETAAAVIADGRTILSSVVSSQIAEHRPFSGVVPELASRAHVRDINDVVGQALRDAEAVRGKSRTRRGKNGDAVIDAIAVTVGPGLVGSLLVGRMCAEALGWARRIPVMGVNHIEGHLLSPLLSDPALKPPFLGLVVSGGHTELIVARAYGRYELLGRTRDDAAGEAFDKAAKMLGLGYPGGPVVDRLAEEGDASRERFPRPWLPGTWDFSFSGLKTALLYRLRDRPARSLADKRHLCAGFRAAIVDVLVGKTVAAARALRLKTVAVGGGVAANRLLRRALEEASTREGFRLAMPPMSLCTDNAAMIGASAYYQIRRLGRVPKNTLKIQPQMHIPFSRRSLSPFRPSDLA